jgi:hypothetical protein
VWSHPPSPRECHHAASRAAGARRTRHRSDPRFAHYTDSALTERVFALPVLPERRRGGWWLVARVVDELADAEFDVMLIPGGRRLGLSRVERPAGMEALPPETSIIYDGCRRRWVWRDTLQPVSELRAGPGFEE